MNNDAIDSCDLADMYVQQDNLENEDFFLQQMCLFVRNFYMFVSFFVVVVISA